MTLDWLAGEDVAMDNCRRLGWYLVRDDGSHERTAYDLGYFLHDRLMEGPTSDHTEALISVVRIQVRIATYRSNGVMAIRQALYVLLRLAMTYQDHADYRPEWNPANVSTDW